jgi:hypothetical protein
MTFRATSAALLCLLYLLNLALGVLAETPSVPADVETSELYQAAKKLTVMTDCPDRVWPNYSWRKLQVVFADPFQENAILWNPQSETSNQPKTMVLPARNFARLAPGGFASGSYQGAYTFLTFRSTSDDTYNLVFRAIHEVFHDTAQSNMPRDPSRGEQYPENWKARYYRWEMLRELRLAVLTGRSEHIRAAVFWNLRLIGDFRADYDNTRVIDVLEGSAEYAGRIGAALASAGCNVTEQQLMDEAKTRVGSDAVDFFKEGESYRLGFLAGLLLRMQHRPDWEKRVASGQRITDILFEKVEPEAQSENSLAAAQFKEHFEKRNNEIRGIGETFFTASESASNYVVAVPMAYTVGSYGASGHVRFPFHGTPLRLMLESDWRFSTGNGGQLRLGKRTVAVVAFETDDSKALVIFPVTREDLQKQKDGTYSINAGGVRGERLLLSSQQVKDFTTWMLVQ